MSPRSIFITAMLPVLLGGSTLCAEPLTLNDLRPPRLPRQVREQQNYVIQRWQSGQVGYSSHLGNNRLGGGVGPRVIGSSVPAYRPIIYRSVYIPSYLYAPTIPYYPRYLYRSVPGRDYSLPGYGRFGGIHFPYYRATYRYPSTLGRDYSLPGYGRYGGIQHRR